MEERNVGTKGKSLKQDLTSIKDLTIELPEGHDPWSASVYTTIAALHGEIGAATVAGRNGKIKLRFGQFMSRTICLDNI